MSHLLLFLCLYLLDIFFKLFVNLRLFPHQSCHEPDLSEGIFELVLEQSTIRVLSGISITSPLSNVNLVFSTDESLPFLMMFFTFLILSTSDTEIVPNLFLVGLISSSILRNACFSSSLRKKIEK